MIGENNIISDFNFEFIFENFIIHCIDNLNCEPTDTNIIDLCVLNFKESELLNEHLRLTFKNFKEPYHYTLFDVYYDEPTMNTNRSICSKYGVTYICFEMIPQYKNIWLCDRLGFKMKCMEKYVRTRKVKYIGFIQQDLYFIKEYNYFPLLEKYKCYGRCLYYIEKGFWYLWNGFSMFDLEKFKDLDYFPNSLNSFTYNKDIPYFENGGNMFYKFFKDNSEYSIDTFNDFIVNQHEKYIVDNDIYKDGKEYTDFDNIRNVACEYFQDESLLHGYSSSNWCNKNEVDIKNIKLLELLRGY